MALRLSKALGRSPESWMAMQHNHDLVRRGREIVLEALRVKNPCPDSLLGAMASVPFPAAEDGSPVARLDGDELAAWTRERGIESWFHPWPGPAGKLVRLSAQIYNTEAEYHSLAALLREAMRAA